MPYINGVFVSDNYERWQSCALSELPADKQAREKREAERLATRNPRKIARLAQAHTDAIVTSLATLKSALTYEKWADVVQAAYALKTPVHGLRISLRAQGITTNLPPRASQFGLSFAGPNALAFAHALDEYLVSAQRDPGPRIALWNMQCVPRKMPSRVLADETRRVDRLRCELRVSPAASRADAQVCTESRESKRRAYCQGEILDELALCLEAAQEVYGAAPLRIVHVRAQQTIARLRAVIKVDVHPYASLPPHPDQYAVAGNHWSINQSRWREAVLAWFDQVDEAYPPSYTGCDATLPKYAQPADIGPSNPRPACTVAQA